MEKPPVIRHDELEELVKTYSRSRGSLLVGYNRRFSKFAQEARKFFSDDLPLIVQYSVNAGALPEDHWISDLEVGGGRIIGESCHFIDFATSIIGKLSVRVFATNLPSSQTNNLIDDTIITVDYQDGSKLSLLYTSLGSEVFSKENTEIHQAQKTFTIDNFLSAEKYTSNSFSTQRSLAQDKGQKDMVARFVQSIKDGEQVIKFEEVISTSLTTFNIIDSVREGRPLKINYCDFTL